MDKLEYFINNSNQIITPTAEITPDKLDIPKLFEFMRVPIAALLISTSAVSLPALADTPPNPPHPVAKAAMNGLDAAANKAGGFISNMFDKLTNGAARTLGALDTFVDKGGKITMELVDGSPKAWGGVLRFSIVTSAIVYSSDRVDINVKIMDDQTLNDFLEVASTHPAFTLSTEVIDAISAEIEDRKEEK